MNQSEDVLSIDTDVLVLGGGPAGTHAPPDPEPRSILRAREAAAMVATARLMYASARARTETRGMHKHEDFPELDSSQQRRLIAGGLERIWVRPEAQSASRPAGALQLEASP